MQLSVTGIHTRQLSFPCIKTTCAELAEHILHEIYFQPDTSRRIRKYPSHDHPVMYITGSRQSDNRHITLCWTF